MPYKGKYFTKKITIGGKAYWVHAKTESEVRRKAEILKKEKQADYDRLQQLSERLTVDAWIERWLSLQDYTPKHKRNVLSTINNWIIPDPDLGAADIKAYNKEKSIRTSVKLDSKNNLKRRRKVDTQLEAERESRLSNADPRPSLRGKRMEDVRQADLTEILIGMKKGGYSASSVKKVRDLLKQIFGDAEVNELVLRNPTTRLKLPEGLQSGSHRAITDHERELTFKAAKTHRGGTFVLLMLYTGMRPQEVAALEWKNVDLENRRIRVTHAIKDNNVTGEPKSKAGLRILPITDGLYDLLKSVNSKSKYVCTNSKGGQYTMSSVQTMWNGFKRAMDIAGGAKTFKGHVIEHVIGEDLTLYSYRHTYGTDLEAAGIPINVAKRLMGHDDIKVTSSIYTHESEEALNSAFDNLNNYYDNKRNKDLLGRS